MKTKIKNVRRPIDVIDISILTLMTAALVFLAVVVFMVCKPIEVKASSIEVYYFDVEEKEAVDLDSQIVLEVEQKILDNMFLSTGVEDVLSEENIEVYPVENRAIEATSEYLYDISDEEVLFFKQIMAAESYSFWTYDEILSLATVVINRFSSEIGAFEYDSFHELFTDGVQFSTYIDGRYKTAEITEACDRAVEDALRGKRNLNERVMYFCTKEYYDSCSNSSFFKSGLNQPVYQVRNVLFFEEP